MHSFKLSSSFLDQFFGKQPDWGYGSLSYITFKRTYARNVEGEDRTEEFWETCKRVVEGVFNIQKRHCLSNKLYWDNRRAQKSAQIMFEKMWSFKFLPPGRGLWMMGTDMVLDKGSAALNNCFSGDTEFIGLMPDGGPTAGLYKFKDSVDKPIRVWNSEHQEFLDAEVKSFGLQSLNRVIFQPVTRNNRSGHKLEYLVTGNHRWILANGTETTNLSVGDQVYSRPINNNEVLANPDVSIDYRTGFAHGLIFGDGTRHTYYPDRHFIRLCGEKNKAYAKILENVDGYVSTTYPESFNGDCVVTIVRPNENWKQVPTSNYTTYYRGFIDGWIAADGHERHGRICLDTQNEQAAEWVIKNATLGGYNVIGYSEENYPTNYGNRKHSLKRVKLSKDIEKYKVIEIEEDVSTEEVFCVVEPKYHSFTLSGGLETGNCGFVSTKEINHGFASPFCWAMDMLMLGVGVGFDTKGAGKFVIKEPKSYEGKYVITDSREGWIEALDVLLSAYEGRNLPEFDFSEIRKAGMLIKGFGGTSSGPAPLKDMLESIKKILDAKISEDITSVDIVDLMNFIGKCVVAGNVRRSAEVALGEFGDESFITCKDFNKYKSELLDRRWASNNSVFAPIGADYTFTAGLTAMNGEPGYAWEENIKTYGRMKDAPDYKDDNFAGLNPCMEQVLETYELCCLVETFPANHESPEEYYDTLKYAYMYAKTVTLVPTHDARTNAVMLRNRRIGLSQSGIEQAKARHGIYYYYSKFCDKGYEIVKSWDNAYSGWLCVPTSKRVTSVKPSGTVSILAGATPGVHAAHSKFYYRTIRLAGNSPIVKALVKSGYRIEFGATEKNKFDKSCEDIVPSLSKDDAQSIFESPISTKIGKQILGGFNGTVVAYFPIQEKNYSKGKSDISIWEQMENVAKMQYYWADNSVSCTITFKPDESKDIKTVLELYQDRLKVVSFLPLMDHGYAQAPYITIEEDEYTKYSKKLKPVVLNDIDESDKQQDKYCTGEACEIDITEKIK